jgi:hypothetical protein
VRLPPKSEPRAAEIWPKPLLAMLKLKVCGIIGRVGMVRYVREVAGALKRKRKRVPAIGDECPNCSRRRTRAELH